MTGRAVTYGLRVYRALAAAFPHEFRNIYGDGMLQMAEEAIEPVWRARGWRGLTRLLFDAAGRIPAEYASEMRQDARYGLRMLRASPGFSAAALLSLALGIGVATAAYSDMNAFILRNVPAVAKPDELVALKSPVSYEMFRRYAARADLFTGTLAYLAPVAFGVSLNGRPERVWGHVTTPSYFDTLGVRPALGRFFGERAGAEVVVSYGFWRDRLGSDPAIAGKTLRINGSPCVVIGVGPEDFRGASPLAYGADIWAPVSIDASIVPEVGGQALERYDRRVFLFAARLRRGVRTARAEAALDAVARGVEQEYGVSDRDRKGRRAALAQGGKLLPLEKRDVPPLAGFFVVLGGLILAIACANVANMMLARAAARRKEIAMRLALGASRSRLVRQLLAESMMLALASGFAGFLLAEWLMRWASQLRLPYPMPLSYDLRPDGGALLFCAALTLLTGIAFGLAPALQATRTDVTPALKERGTIQIRRYRRLSLRNILMTSQVAASLALLLIMGFMVIGQRHLAGTDLGFDPARIQLLSLDPVRDGYSRQRTQEFFEKLRDRVARLREVASSTLADAVPMTMIGKPMAPYAAITGSGKAIRWAHRYGVGREFFETMGIPVWRGRGFTRADEADDSAAAIVSEKLAADCWPGEDAVGRHIEVGDDDVPVFRFGGGAASAPPSIGRTRTVEIVGVVKNIREGFIGRIDKAPGVIYLPLRASDMTGLTPRGITLVLRGAPGADAATAGRREIAAIDDRITLYGSRSLSSHVDDILSPMRVGLCVYGCIGLFGMLLAAVGLAGVTAYTVTRRRREIGIRIAVGAQRGDVLRLVMKEGLTLVTIGSLIGFVAAQAGIHAMGAVMSEVARTSGTSTSDPALLIGAPSLLAVVALASCYWPARASTRIDPVEALRQE